MRCTLLFGVLAGLLAGSGPALAQTYPLKATVVVPKVEVRSGPTDKYYVTAELQQGESVTIVRPSKEAGWLEIKPPRGSFTWINAKHVKLIDPYEAVAVDADPNSSPRAWSAAASSKPGPPSK